MTSAVISSRLVWTPGDDHRRDECQREEGEVVAPLEAGGVEGGDQCGRETVVGDEEGDEEDAVFGHRRGVGDRVAWATQYALE